MYLLAPICRIVDDSVDDAAILNRLLDLTTAAVRKTMRSILGLSNWTVRAVRRGGLSSMSMAGVSHEIQRTFSQHTTNKRLLTYLGSGRLDGVTITNQHNAQDRLLFQ